MHTLFPRKFTRKRQEIVSEGTRSVAVRARAEGAVLPGRHEPHVRYRQTLSIA